MYALKGKQLKLFYTKVGGDIIYGRTSACSDAEVKSSNPHLGLGVDFSALMLLVGVLAWYSLELDADLHMAQLMPLPLTVS